MLQLKTINSATCALLQQMSAMEAMSEFSLAGGTALALQLGHRISIDLDFFTLNTFDTEEISTIRYRSSFCFLRKSTTI